MTDDIAYKTPIADLLADIPEDARQMYEHHRTHHQNIPFGRLAKEALEEIESLRRERDRLWMENARLNAKLYRCAVIMECNDPGNHALLFGTEGETE